MRRNDVEAAFERYGPVVYRRALAILGDEEEARDVMQDVFIKLLSGRLATEAPLAGWLQVVTTRACLNHRRNRSRRAELLAQHAGHGSNPFPEEDKRLLVQSIMHRVEPRIAEAAICVHIDGMTYDETSRHLKVSRRTVANLLSRFQKSAREFVERPPRVLVEENG